MMAFTANNQRLIAQEMYWKWRLRGFDLSGSCEVPDWPNIEIGVGGFAIDPQGNF
jgi:hypothetical protein